MVTDEPGRGPAAAPAFAGPAASTTAAGCAQQQIFSGALEL